MTAAVVVDAARGQTGGASRFRQELLGSWPVLGGVMTVAPLPPRLGAEHDASRPADHAASPVIDAAAVFSGT